MAVQAVPFADPAVTVPRASPESQALYARVVHQILREATRAPEVKRALIRAKAFKGIRLEDLSVIFRKSGKKVSFKIAGLLYEYQID